MYRTLFDLAGPAILAWGLLIFLPTWQFTRWLAQSAIVPVYLAVLYAVGVFGVFLELGPGIMADFGTSDGVLGVLRVESVALVAWIHILVFDQVIAHLIYRDNMTHRFVPLPLQSVILVLTLMVGPLGFLTYWVFRVGRSRRLLAWGEAEAATSVSAKSTPVPMGFSDVVTEDSVIPAVLGLWRRERMLVGLGSAGLLLAVVCAGVAFVNGGWLIPPEGRLLEAAKFDAALGIYLLTLALILPLAGMTRRGRRRWVSWTLGLSIFAFAMENIQAWRGLDPRFSKVAGAFDQALGGLFFLSALGVAAVFVILIAGFFRRDTLPDHPALRLALRYAGAAALMAFTVGVLMSVLQGRFMNGTGNLMPIHASGFHGLQALPLVALLFGWSRIPTSAAVRWVHFAGIGWLAVCLGLLAQAVAGLEPTRLTPAMLVSIAGGVLWAGTLLYAWRASLARTARALAA